VSNLASLDVTINLADNEETRFHQLIDSIRAENYEKGFLSDEEINAEIQAYRNEKRAASV
jgi:hypothetical protein